MIKQIKSKNITWINVNSPSQEEINTIAKDFDIHIIVQDELLRPTPRSKIDLYDNFIYLVLHFPDDNIDDGDGTKEIDFIIGKDFLITAHYEPIQAIDEFAKILEASANLGVKKEIEAHAGYLFYYILRQLYQSLQPNLEFIYDNLKRTEKKIFAGQEREMVEVLSNINHHLLDVKWSLNGQRDVLASLEIAVTEFYGPKFKYYINSIINEYKKVYSMVENNENAFIELRSTNESMLAIKNNEIMKVLASIAFILLPANLIAQVFGMSGLDGGFPILREDLGFYLFIGVMAITVIIMLIFVKYKKWL